jgi:bacteriocin-like protein
MPQYNFDPKSDELTDEELEEVSGGASPPVDGR